MIEACEHLESHSAGHETRVELTGVERLAYPAPHIEADNRLAWFLGRLDKTYGDRAFYVHLRRDPDQVARSFAKRKFGLMHAYMHGILQRSRNADRVDVARDLVDTITQNIQHFLQDKPNQMDIWLETAAETFPEFAERIGATGDLDAAIAEFSVKHNATVPTHRVQTTSPPLASRALRKLAHIIDQQYANQRSKNH
jgi:hypothetical protein